MDIPFVYSKYVTGKNFLGRKKDVSILANLLSQGENIALYSAPKTGKSSLLQQTFLQMQLERKNFRISEVNLLNIRDIQTFLKRMGDAVLKAYADTPGEYISIISKFLAGTHFIFDERSYTDRGEILSLNWDMDSNDIHAILSFPFNLARVRDSRSYIVLNEFQCLALCDGHEQLFKAMENVIKEQKGMLEGSSCSFIMVGSQINAMKDIFEHRRFFYRLCEKTAPGEIDLKDITEYVVKSFLTSGKVIEKEKIPGVYDLFDGHPWYINHFFSICDHLSKGYVMDSILTESLEILISIHEPKFKDMMNDLTTFQVGLLRAIIEGNTRFSSAEVIKKYGLNSSANVKRLKDALKKKEVVTFDANDDPHMTDPLFEYWLRKYFFRQTVEL